MKFGKQLREQTLKEWRFYAVDYKELKKCIKNGGVIATTGSAVTEEGGESVAKAYADTHTVFFDLLDENQHKLTRFYQDKENWATQYMKTLEERVQELRDVQAKSDLLEPSTQSMSDSTTGSITSDSEDEGNYIDNQNNIADITFLQLSKHQSFGTKQSLLKDEYRRMGSSKHFKAFIYAKKSLATFGRELDFLLEFLQLNKIAFSKILKKFDKVMNTSIRNEKFEEIMTTCAFLQGEVLADLKEETAKLIDETNALKPELPEGWENRKVYTIGCFDLFHRGHQNVLMSLREFGYYVVAGIHDDESYFKLKNKYTIDNLETRMENIKPFVDQIFVIPSTDPLIYIKSMVSQQDIDMGACCYARGDDMLDFPGREWVESVMPVHFVPRTEACSSTLIRTIYHSKDETLRKKAAFAKTSYDGKPIDEDGNVLKLKVVC